MLSEPGNDTAQRLIELALEIQVNDNVTAVVLDIEEDAAAVIGNGQPTIAP